MKNPWHVAWQTSPLQRVWPMVHQPRSPGRWARERPMQWVAHQIELKMQQVFWESHPASTTPHRYHPTWYFSQWWPILHQVPGAPWKKCNTECAKATAAVSRFLCWQATSLAEKRAATLASQKLSGRWPKPFGAKRCWWELIARSLDWKNLSDFQDPNHPKSQPSSLMRVAASREHLAIVAAMVSLYHPLEMTNMATQVKRDL